MKSDRGPDQQATEEIQQGWNEHLHGAIIHVISALLLCETCIKVSRQFLWEAAVVEEH